MSGISDANGLDNASFTDGAGNAESLTSAATDTVAAAPEPLTASFSGVPTEHRGEVFTFGLTFSEELELSYKTLRDEALKASGGGVRRAKRQQLGSNRSWTIHVEPASHGWRKARARCSTTCTTRARKR